MANQPTEHCGADVAAKAIALFGFMGGFSRLSVDRGNEITGYRPASAKGQKQVWGTAQLCVRFPPDADSHE